MAVNNNMNTVRKAYEVLLDYSRLSFQNDDGTDEDSHELYEALQVALPLVRDGIKCDRCQAKAKELSDTGFSYCRRCWRAVTNGSSPY